jgi:hypothetical protein
MNMHDVLEEMEHLVPEYSYANLSAIVRTDKLFRQALIDDIKEIKDYLFHAVQASYELQRDALSRESESAWLDVDLLLGKVRNSGTGRLEEESETACTDCRRRIEHDMVEVLIRDREIARLVRELKAITRELHKELFQKGNERRFIKNLDKIKECAKETERLVREREKHIMGL